MTSRFILPWILLFWVEVAMGQKGLPSDTPTSATVNTFYPAIVDFNDSLTHNLKLADGYTLGVAATGLGKPRMMAIAPNGGLYVTRRNTGDVLVLTDPGQDGRFQTLKTVISKFPGVHGIAVRDGWIYLCSPKILAKGKLNPDYSIGPLDTIVNNLPEGGQHDNRTLGFDKEGFLYISVGSDCNDCKETNPEHATIVRMKTDGSDRKVYARGLRNTIGFDWHPVTGELWGMDHGTDWRGDSIPPEELNLIKEKGNYGWPQVYGKQQVDNTREDPLGTTKAAYAKTTEASTMEFPAHSAPINFKFYSTPAARDSSELTALVTMHGSWNRKNPEGYNVQAIRFSNGRPVRVEKFLDGFLSADGKSRFGRPTGLAISTTGIIYLSDDENGVIYAIRPGSQSK